MSEHVASDQISTQSPSRPPESGDQPYRGLRIERHGPVGWLIFDRPRAGNAMNADMINDLPLAWAELDADPSVRVIVNTGAGKSFQTGLDVAQLARDPAALREESRRTRRAELRLTAWHNRVATPVIAAVNGICAGGGLHFVADADIVIAAADAQFLDTHVSVGQATAFEGIGLVRRTAFETVLRMTLAGRHERLSAARAYQIGMVSQLVDPPERLREEAQALAEKVARNSPTAMAATKRALWAALETGLTAACHAGAAELVAMWGHPDQLEGPAAFVEKREPRWADYVLAAHPDQTRTAPAAATATATSTVRHDRTEGA
jgi:enoyl-CoA hydratase/carnithine racemase